MYLALTLAVAHILAQPIAPQASAPPATVAQHDAAPARDAEVLVRVQGDAEIGEDERMGLVIVVNGDARITGTVETLAVVRGTADLRGARIGDLFVYEGRASLGPQTVVGGDLNLINSELETAPDAVVIGEVIRDRPPWELPGLGVVGTLLGLGAAFVVILAGVAAAALAPRGVRRTGETLTTEVGKTLLAALVVWIAVPLLAGLAMVTVVGAPLGMTVFAVALPALALLGYLVAGIRLGDAVLGTTRRRHEVRPTGAAAAGLAILLVVGLVPLLGAIVTFVAMIVGSGALALTLWRRARRPEHALADDAQRRIAASSSTLTGQ